MERLLEVGLGNAVAAALLAPVAAAIGALSGRRPSWAHGLWLLVLLRLVMPPLWAVPVGGVGPTPRPAAVPASARPEPVFEARPTRPSTVGVAPDPGALAPLPGWPVSVHRPRSLLADPPASAPGAAVAPGPPPWRSLALGVWLVGTAAWSALAARRIARFGRALRGATPASAELRGHVAGLAGQVGLRRVPEVALVEGHVGPMVWAFVGRPRLIVPAALWATLDTPARDALLLHELAHLKRGDHRVRLLELLATGLYWWHPALWWARRGLHRAEERCVDALVVATRPGSARAYASALLDVVDFLSTGRAASSPPLAVGMGRARHRHLEGRIAMIMRDEAPRRPSRLGALGLLGLGVLLLPWSPTAARQAAQEEPKKAATIGRAAAGPGDGPLGAVDARIKLAEAERDRVRTLRAQMSISQIEVDRAEGALSVLRQARAEVLGARAEEVERAREAVELLEVQLEVKRGEVEAAEARGEATKAEVDLFGRISQKSPASVSISERQKADADHRASLAEIVIRKAELRGAELQIKHARRQLARLEPVPSKRAANLHKIALALQHYADAHDGRFPPTAILDKSGRPLLSWRVAILPYLDEPGAKELFGRFKLDEPWDTAHNQGLLKARPASYGSDSPGDGPVATNFFAVYGDRTAWGATTPDITDGISNTLLVVEGRGGAFWTRPTEMTDPGPDVGRAVESLLGPDPLIAMADGTVRHLRPTTPLAILHSLTTRAGGEIIDQSIYEPLAETSVAVEERGDDASARRLAEVEAKLDRLLKKVEGATGAGGKP